MSDKKKTEAKEDSGHNVLILGNKCFRCGHIWVQREEEKPAVCPKCKSPYWDKPKTKFLNKKKK
jgi:predicted Zn-ribbon and HTH transcriptional regulator